MSAVCLHFCQLFVYILWNICLHFFRWQLKFFIQTKKHHGKERLKFTKQLYWDMKIFWDLLQQTSEVNIWFSWHFFKISISRVFLFNCSGTGNGSQRLIITDYHQNGSLHDFLKENIIDQNDLVSLNFFLNYAEIFSWNQFFIWSFSVKYNFIIFFLITGTNGFFNFKWIESPSHRNQRKVCEIKKIYIFKKN